MLLKVFFINKLIIQKGKIKLIKKVMNLTYSVVKVIIKYEKVIFVTGFIFVDIFSKLYLRKTLVKRVCCFFIIFTHTSIPV